MVAKFSIAFVGLLVGGCSLNQQERQSIIDASGELAAERAGTLALVNAKEAGVSDEDAEKVAEYAREKARRAASEVASRLTPKVEEGKRSKVGAFFAALLMAALQLGVAALRTASA
jgi:acyl-CoA reductase-like NAD-dependent aldehyde dehydrogenase